MLTQQQPFRFRILSLVIARNFLLVGSTFVGLEQHMRKFEALDVCPPLLYGRLRCFSGTTTRKERLA